MYFAQGFRSLSSLSTEFFLREELGLQPAALQGLLAAAALPWSLKPLYGLASDALPVFGQHRKPYLILAAVIGVFAWSALAAIAVPQSSSSLGRTIGGITTLLWLTNLSTALSDVIVDAMVAERCGEAARAAEARGDANAATAATEGENALQSLCWGSLAIGGLAGSLVGMFAASAVPVWAIFALTASCPGLVLLASRALTEGSSEPSKAGCTGRERSTGRLESVRAQLVALIAALREPSIWRPLSFFLLQNALVPSCHQAMQFFMVDELGFSREFLSAQRFAAFLFLLVGTAIYSRFVQGIGFLRLFAWCQCAGTGLCLLDVLLASGVTARVGLPNHVFVLGTDALGVVLNRLTMQPFLVIAARLCPPGCEAALYAFFMSTYNFGNTLSGAFGSALTPLFGIEKGKYERLPQLLLVRAACTLLPLALLRPLLGGVDRLKTH